MKKLLLVLLVLVFVGGGYYAMSMQSDTQKATMTIEEEAIEGVKKVTIDGFEFGYDKQTITVKKGDTVTVTLTNSGEMPHDWVVDEFAGGKTKEIKNGETDTITFVADKVGTFEFYCSVGSHREKGMVGSLIVEE